MTLEELRQATGEGISSANGKMTLVLPQGFKRPAKFPRGELLCENTDGRHVWMFDAWRILKWLDSAEQRD